MTQRELVNEAIDAVTYLARKMENEDRAALFQQLASHFCIECGREFDEFESICQQCQQELIRESCWGGDTTFSRDDDNAAVA